MRTSVRRRARASVIGVLFGVATVLTSAPAALATGPAGGVIFDSIPDPLPGNVVSLGFEATSTSEFGDYATFEAGNPNGILQNVDVVMSSWGCEDGTWHQGTCETSSGATFSHPITFTIYENDAGAPGDVLATVTDNFDIPYRPSADPDCSGGRWQDSSGGCFNGLATTITFDFSGAALELPDSVIYGIAYDTTHYGASPIGESADCYTESGGCGYDSLNVGASSGTPSAGTDDDGDATFLDSTWGGAYCDGGVGGTGTFRLDDGCWAGNNPNVRFNAGSAVGDCLFALDPVEKKMTLLADCTTDHTIEVENGWTLNGDDHTITGVDPAAGHFVGAVVQAEAGADPVVVRNVGITVAGLADVCDDGAGRLRGILFDGVGGAIRNNEVVDLNQANGTSGCQEGNAIEARNAPFNAGGTDVQVAITGNVVTDYQKTGILTNGSVVVTIRDNVATGFGPVNFIAQNGIQVGFGATALVRENTVSGNNYTPPDTVACGLLMFEADGVKKQDNEFFENEKNLCNFGRGGGSFPNP